jgi:pSer/pThr/pTyr-binding forkhead associated (FHA) protein
VSARSLTFGQAPTSETHIHIDDPYASTVHCRITEDERGKYWIEDLGSTNGTRIDRPGFAVIKVDFGWKSLLKPGDRVIVGRTVLPWEAQ